MKITDEKLDKMLKNEENPSFDCAFEFKGKKEKEYNYNKNKLIGILAASLVFVMLASALFIALRPGQGKLPVDPSDVDSDLTVNVDGDHGMTPTETAQMYDTSGNEPDHPETDPVVTERPGPVEADGITVYTLTSGYIPQYGGYNDRYVNRCVAGIDSAKINRITDARYLNITPVNLDSEHACHSCLIYDTVEDKFICGSCILSEKADSITRNKNESIIIDNISTPDTLLFAVWNDNENKIVRRYLYDVKTDVLTRIPAPSSNDFDTLAASEDFRYIVSHDYRKTDADLDDVYLIDTLANTYVNISGDYPTFMLSRIIDGRFVLNALKYYGSTENFDSELCRFIVYDTESKVTTECMGKVLRYSGGMLLTRDGERVHHLYDLANGREVEITKNTYYWDNINGDLYRGNAYNGKTYLTDETVAAIYVSEDGENVYTYNSGAGYIVKRSLDGHELQVPLDSAFTSETEKMAETMDFTFMLREKNDVIVLLYTTTEKPVSDPDNPEQPQITSNHDAVFDVLKNDKVSSIKEAVTALKEKYPKNDFGFTVSEGDGFTVLYIDARDGTKRAFAEDYRDNTFSAYYEGKDRAYIRLLSYAPGKYERRKLTSTEAETKAFIKQSQIPTGQADLDYAIFYDNGEFSEEKVKDYSFINTSNISFFYAFCGSHGIGVYDKTNLVSFLSEFAFCGRQKTKMLADDDYITYGEIKTNTKLELTAAKDKNGNFCIRVNYEDVYIVPEYVFADLASLAASAFAESGFRPMSKNEQNGYADGFGSISKAPMTVKQLKDALKNGLTYDKFAGYKSELFSVSINKEYPKFNTVTSLIALENGGFVYLTYKGESKEVIQARLFDSTLRFCGDLLTEGYTGLTPKGKLTFPEYDLKFSAADLPSGGQPTVITVKFKEPCKEPLEDLFPWLGIEDYEDANLSRYAALYDDALAGNGVTWEEVDEFEEKIGTEFIIWLKDAEKEYILFEIDLLKSNPLVESVDIVDQ